MVKCNSSPSKCLDVYKTFTLSNHHHCQSARLFHYPKLEHACLSLRSPPTHLFLYPSPWVTVVSFFNFVDLRALIKVDSCEICSKYSYNFYLFIPIWFSWDKIEFCSSGWPEIHYEAWASSSWQFSCLNLPRARIVDVSHYPELLLSFGTDSFHLA